jgi:Caspase domain
VVMTPESDESNWVKRELIRAEEGHKPIVPLLLKGERFFGLSDLQFEDVTGGRMPGEPIVRQLRALVTPEPHDRPHDPAPVSPLRWFVGAATTVYGPETGLEDRPELADEVERMAMLFTGPGGLGYRRVPGFGANLDRDVFLGRLRTFVTHPDRREDDLLVVYYAGHGEVLGGELLLPMADATADVAYTALPAAELTGRLLAGPQVKVRRLLYLVDTCYAATAGTALTGGGVDVSQPAARSHHGHHGSPGGDRGGRQTGRAGHVRGIRPRVRRRGAPSRQRGT